MAIGKLSMPNSNIHKMAPDKRSRKPKSRQRYQDKRERILIAATELINERGTKGMTLSNVASAVGLNTPSVTYYFRRKELLAAAVFKRALERLEAIVQYAAQAPTPQERVARFIVANVDLREQVLRGTGLPLAKLSDIRTLDEVYRTPLEKHFQAIFRQVRGYFGPIKGEMHKALLTARTHMLLEVALWLPIWVGQYSFIDFARIKVRLIDLLTHGIAEPGARWTANVLELDEEQATDDEEGQDSFLRVATRLINDAGYRGASVERIAKELNVTKGSFYHHLDAKDDLVLECFRRSFRRYSHILGRAEAAEQNGWGRLTTAISTLLDIQFYSDRPLLRTTAFQALPPDLRSDMIARTNRGALRLAGNLVDAMQDGSIRILDPHIASQLIIATVNTAYDLRKWAASLPRSVAITLYASSLFDGLFDDRVIDRIERMQVDLVS